MKKLLLAAAITGLVAVPTLVSARHGADDNNKATDVRQEDRKVKSANTSNATTTSTNGSLDDSTTTEDTNDDSQTVANASTSNETTVGGVKVEKEANLPENAVSMEDAQATAQAVFADKTIKKVEIEKEHGSVVYSFRFSDGSRVDVDAATGEVVSSRDKTKNENTRQDDRGHHGSGNSGRDSDDD